MDGRSDDTADDPADARRASSMSALALADAKELAELWARAGLEPRYETLRGPEVGLTMTRGRAGAAGAAFNLGEATVTRCVVRLDSGVGGAAYVLGRAPEKARIAALCDALLQTEAAETVRAHILEPLERSRAIKIREAERAAAGTQVEFFTMTRGEP
ncbi:MAG: phosphonate C-P lyase system protein PhnG [Pseudomonadota bacterium]